MLLVKEEGWLLDWEAGVAEHADLVRDVVPGAGGLQLLQAVAQALPHVDDSE